MKYRIQFKYKATNWAIHELRYRDYEASTEKEAKDLFLASEFGQYQFYDIKAVCTYCDSVLLEKSMKGHIQRYHTGVQA